MTCTTLVDASPRVVYEDADVVVADKPLGLSIEAAGRESGDDLTTMLRVGGADRSALRAQQHVDRDVSGLVVFSKTQAATKRMASAEMTATYVVAVDGLALRGRTELRGWLSRRGDKWQVRVNKAVEATEIRCAVEVLARNGTKTLLRVRSTSPGRVIRSLLQAHGAAAVGDAERGGAPWHRVLLHTSGVTFAHPRTGAPISAVSEEPWELRAWLAGGKLVLDRSTAASAFEQACRVRAGLQARSEAYRVFHGEGEGLPGVDLDRFGQHLVLWVDEQLSPGVRDELVEAAWALGPSGLYVKVRPKAASRLDERDREGLAPRLPVRGTAAPDEIVVREDGIAYLVRLGDGLATGLFLDQRGNRGWIREQSRDARVLNLFAYTCAFTVAAAAGGASATTSVDISARALETGGRNLHLGGWDSGQHELVRDDVGRWVHQAQGKGRRFDVIVLDPPSFGSSRHGRFSAEDDYGKLATEVVRLISEKGGVLLACTNHRAVSQRRFRAWVTSAVAAAGRAVRGVKEAPPGRDFPVPGGGEPHMKALRVWIESR